MTGPQAIASLRARAVPDKAAGMAAYHKAPREYLGISVPQIEELVRDWKRDTDMAGRVALASELWDSNIHEARLAAAKLLIQARIKEHEAAVWAEFQRWLPDFDGWALADHACKVAERRLVADPSRLDTVETWTDGENKWVRRAALVATLPWSKLNHPDATQTAARERILGWAASYVSDRDWFMQKAVAWWLRSLSAHDPDRTSAFLAGPGAGLKAFARKDAGRKLPA